MDLARAIGVTFQQVQKYEKGTNRVSSGKLQQIARLLKVPISLFFGETGGPKGKTGEPDYLVVLCNTPGGLQLARAFSRIKSKRLRASIVKLVELAAKT